MTALLFPLLLSANNIYDKIIDFYKNEYPEIKIIEIKHKKAFPKKYKQIKFLFSPKSPRGNIKIDGNYYFISIKAKLPVYKSIKIIKQNSFIIPEINVKKELVDFKYFYSKPLNSIPKNILSSKIISKNAIINQNNTKKAPAVFKNQIIRVVLSSKNIKIFSLAKALKDGNIGDIIPIKINKKTFKAKIIDKDTVRIER